MAEAGSVILLVLVWFSTASVNVIAAKITLSKLQGYAWVLTFSQLVISWVCGRLYLGKIKPLTKVQRRITFGAGLTTWIGLVCTNQGFNYMNSSLVETIKAAEPVAGTIIGALFTKEGWPPFSILRSLAIVVVGVMLASWSDASFAILGVLATILANFFFSCSNVFSKMNHEQDEPLDGITYWHCDVCYGLCFAAIFAVPELHRLLTTVEPMQLRALAPVVLLNGVAFWTYNACICLVTKHIHFSTFLVVNTIRRATLITSSVVYFGIEMSGLNMVGLGIASLGFLVFLEEKKKMHAISAEADAAKQA